MPFLLSYQNVVEYLISQKICTQKEQSLSKIELKPAKNFNLLVSLSDGRQLLVKQEPYKQDDTTIGEFANEWKIHNFCQIFPEINHLQSYISEVIYFDSENSIIVFNYLQEYRDLANFYTTENFFPTEIAQSIGTTLSSIHHLTLNSQKYQQFFQNAEGGISRIPNFTKGLDRITPEIFALVPADGLKFFALYQRYDNLGKAIADLRASFSPCCLTHNDLKLNNILLSLNWETAIYHQEFFGDSIIRLIDWERGNWGDPASDLGAIIASYLQIWLYSMVTSKMIPIEDSLRLAAIPLQVMQPSLSALLKAYLADFPEILQLRPNFLELVMQFCGLALIRSIQATLQHEKTFGNTGICILQVAKSLLCRPNASITTIFGMQPSDLIPTSLSLA